MAKARDKRSEARLAVVRAALAAGRAEEAALLSLALLERTPNDPAALNLAGVAAFQIGQRELAKQHLEAAAMRRPRDPDIMMNLGNVLADLGDVAPALAAYDAADAIGKSPEPAFNAGLMLMRQGRLADAKERFRRAVAIAPHPGAALAGADILRLEGRLADARAALVAIVTARPGDPVGHVNLAAVCQELGDLDAGREHAEEACRLAPGMHEAQFNLGAVLLAADDNAAAAERFRRVLGLHPGHAAAALNLGEASLGIGNTDTAAQAYRRALEIDPGFAKAAVAVADLDLAANDPTAALGAIERFLATNPAQPLALAFKAALLREIGDDNAALELLGLDDMLTCIDVEAPAGYADVGEFNDALAAHVLAHPTLTPSPESHATRSGRHSGELLAEPMGPIAELADIIRTAAADYIDRLSDDRHPFRAGRPTGGVTSMRLSVWGVVMHQDGHQVPHIHPAAWLSGVYYPRVPGDVAADDPGHTGWIEFGRPPEDYHLKRAPDVRLHCPRGGRMFLFPSYLYHRTVPLDIDSERISIAFDLMVDAKPIPAGEPT
ncbi:MAG: tetratricopeptide repeat protein [Proteobacteria bacterium]|nr:tetratricopeptide repeat protein [Pseudomonadota bacterium]